ncbi:MAG: hypothetical protein BGO92_04960 [Magnetospirillum sp. 64-120]|uniref:hypothetical protein n=1 Tax=Magnetospirillum sp. 64-120 TaxID=1895778 RepID=UPI000926B40E|nr:hypothetical protein [Magnetospirillum sp. 64-120]OJX82929.1 MAG: hypothetical protein BGO92_04960 [Magnetospirillum sp. 64-120]
MTNTAIAHLPETEAPSYRFDSADRIQIDGSDYAPVSRNKFGYVLKHLGEDGGLTISMDHTEIEERIKRGTLVVHRDWYDPRRANLRLQSPAPLLCDLPEKEQRIILWRIEFCERFLRMEASEPTVSRADEAMRPAIVRIQDDLLRLEAARQGKPRRCGRKTEHFDPPSPLT